MSFKYKYYCFNYSPKEAFNTVKRNNYSFEVLSCDLLDVPKYSNEYKDINKAMDVIYKFNNIIYNRKRILKGIIILQRKYKNYLYSPKSEYGKKLMENGENKLKEFA